MKRGQISLEYLMIIGFIVFLVIVILGAALLYAAGIRDQITLNQIENFAEKIISNSEAVHFSGEPSKVTVNAFLPGGVRSVEVIDQSLVVEVYISSGLNRIAFSSDVPFSGTFTSSEGNKRFQIVALEGGGVLIEEG